MEANSTLLTAARRMKGDALAQIFDLYAPALYNYVLRTGSDPVTADHIVGDVFAKLLDQLSCGNGPHTNLRSYLFQATYHLLIEEVRYSYRRAPLEVVDLFQQDGHSIFTDVENRILFEMIMQAIYNDLTQYQRHVIVLRFLEGFSLRETAAIVGKAVNNIKVTQNRAIAVLRKALYRQLVFDPVPGLGQVSRKVSSTHS